MKKLMSLLLTMSMLFSLCAFKVSANTVTFESFSNGQLSTSVINNLTFTEGSVIASSNEALIKIEGNTGVVTRPVYNDAEATLNVDGIPYNVVVKALKENVVLQQDFSIESADVTQLPYTWEYEAAGGVSSAKAENGKLNLSLNGEHTTSGANCWLRHSVAFENIENIEAYKVNIELSNVANCSANGLDLRLKIGDNNVTVARAKNGQLSLYNGGRETVILNSADNAAGNAAKLEFVINRETGVITCGDFEYTSPAEGEFKGILLCTASSGDWGEIEADNLCISAILTEEKVLSEVKTENKLAELSSYISKDYVLGNKNIATATDSLNLISNDDPLLAQFGASVEWTLGENVNKDGTLISKTDEAVETSVTGTLTVDGQSYSNTVDFTIAPVVTKSEVVDFALIENNQWTSAATNTSTVTIRDGYGVVNNTAMSTDRGTDTLSYSFKQLPSVANMDELVFEYDYKMIQAPSVSQIFGLYINEQCVGSFGTAADKLFGNSDIENQPWYGKGDGSDRGKGIAYPTTGFIKLKMVVDLEACTTTYYVKETVKEKVIGTYDCSSVLSSINSIEKAEFKVGLRNSSAVPIGEFAAIDNLALYSRVAPEEEFITGTATKLDFKHDFESSESQAILSGTEGVILENEQNSIHGNVYKITNSTAKYTEGSSANNLRYNERVSVDAELKIDADTDGTAKFVLYGLQGSEVINVYFDINNKKVNLSTTKNIINASNDGLKDEFVQYYSFDLPGNVLENEWFSMHIDYNIMSKTYNVYLNGTLINELPLVTSRLDVSSAPSAAIRGFSLSANNATVYFDNFSIMRKKNIDEVKVNAALNAALVMYANDIYHTALTHGTPLKEYIIKNCGNEDGSQYVYGDGVTLDNPANYAFVSAGDSQTPKLTYRLNGNITTEITAELDIIQMPLEITAELGDYSESRTVARKIAPVEIHQVSKTVNALNAVRIAGNTENAVLFAVSYTESGKLAAICQGQSVLGVNDLYKFTNIYAPGKQDKEGNTIHTVKIFVFDNTLKPMTEINVYK